VGLTEDNIDGILAKLEQHGMVKLGEHSDITLDVSRKILMLAL
jgi:NADP-dependent alcohol dehydrogenase